MCTWGIATKQTIEMLPAFDERGGIPPWSKKRGDFKKNKKRDPILDGNISRDYQTLVHITI